MRHGARSPLRLPYPTDANTEETWPNGWAWPTQSGLDQSLQAGRWFRSHYGGFIKQHYVAKEALVASTDSDRTVLTAGMWAEGVWPGSRVPVRRARPEISANSNANCSFHRDFRRQRYAYEEFNTKQKYAAVFSYLAKETGQPNFSLGHAFGLCEVFKEMEAGRARPAWMERRWSQFGNKTTEDILKEIERIGMWISIDDPSASRILAGHALHTYIEAMKQHDSARRPSRVYFTAGHDSNLEPMTYLLAGFTQRSPIPPPPYTTTILWELHHVRGVKLVKIFYRQLDGVLWQLDIPGCGPECELTRFEHIYQPVTVASKRDLAGLCS